MHPDIEIEFITSVRLVDLSREEADIGVRYSLGEYEGVVSTPLVRVVLSPVCAPSVLAAAGGDLNRLVTETEPIQTSGYNEWRDWSAQTGIELSQGRSALMIEDFLVAIRAVILGQGLALLPRVLVQDLIDAGELVLFSDPPLQVDHTYNVAHTLASAKRQHVQAVVDWLRSALAAAGLTALAACTWAASAPHHAR